MPQPTNAVRLDRLTVMHGRMRLEVSLANHAPQRTDPMIASRALALYSTIASHSCVNQQGPSFGDVIEDTSVPHLLEHMIIEEQIAGMETETTTTFVGTTHWTKDHRHAMIEINFQDDLIAVRAIRRALDSLNTLLRL